MSRSSTVLALTVVVAVATGCGGDEPSSAPPAPAPTTAATPAGPTESPVTQGSKGGVVLGGTELGVTRLGEPFRESVAAVSEVLGAPDEDPASTVSCIEAETEVRWGDLVLAAQDDRLAGWSSSSATLQTPSGVTVGTPLTEVERVYGPSLERFPEDPDNPPTFRVPAVDVSGELSSSEQDASVTRLFTSFCAGP